jgi:hypothetical protein
MCSFLFSVNVQSIDYISVYMKFICSTDLTLVKKKNNKVIFSPECKKYRYKIVIFRGSKKENCRNFVCGVHCGCRLYGLREWG